MGSRCKKIFLLMLFFPFAGWAQTLDCEQTLALATEEFNAGHFYSVPSTLSECLTKFNRDQRLRAHLLLTQTYLLLDDPIGARRSYLEVLDANPEFVPDEKLHAIDVVYLSKRFTATPRFSWFMGGGSNVSMARVIHDMDVMEDKSEKYDLRVGYHFGGGGEYSYDDHLRLRLEIDYMHTTYKARAFDYFNADVKTFTDRQTWITLPLYVCYSDHVGRYRPYALAGFSFSMLMGDRATIELRKIQGEGEEKETFDAASPDFDFFHRRNRFNQAIILGGGIKYKVGLDFVFAEARYSAGLKNIVRADTRFGNYKYEQTSAEWVQSYDPSSQYAHVDDFLRLDNLMFTVGFLRPLYKPRELKRVRTQGVLRKMKRTK